MPIKYVCGKCGKEMTEDEFNQTQSIRLVDEIAEDEILAEDLCKDCEEFLVKLIKETIIAPIPKE